MIMPNYPTIEWKDSRRRIAIDANSFGPWVGYEFVAFAGDEATRSTFVHFSDYWADDENGFDTSKIYRLVDTGDLRFSQPQTRFGEPS
jgi:hypothetical protein